MAVQAQLLVCVLGVVALRVDAGAHIKDLDDTILFRINWGGGKDLLGSPDYEKLTMKSSKNEYYECLVPISHGEDDQESDTYTGPGPLALLTPLFQKQTCNLRLESYWTYELCHGLYMKQYREERIGRNIRLHEYILGEFSSEDLQTLRKEIGEGVKPTADIPTTKVEGVDMPYFMVNYTRGTLCDLTGQPRVSHILFVCYEDGRHDIYTIKETYTCEYEIVILSPYLCQHPAYRPKDLPQTNLHCIPMEGSPKRPRNLLQIEAESLKLRSSGAVLSGDTSSGSVKLEVLEDQEKAAPPPDAPTRLPSQAHPGFDHKLIVDFLNGEYCLHGGSGWWKYEFCYGRKVEQYHEDRTGARTSILLGQFFLDKHKAWLEENPEKYYKSGKRQVSHFYSGGTTCDLTDRPRQVEVKLKCRESNSPSSVTLYLLEPHTCEYVLGVETPIMCLLLPHVDEHGLITKPISTLSLQPDAVTSSSRPVAAVSEGEEADVVSYDDQKEEKEGDMEEKKKND